MNKAARNALICIALLLFILAASNIKPKKLNIAKGIVPDLLEQFRGNFMPTNTKNLKKWL